MTGYPENKNKLSQEDQEKLSAEIERQRLEFLAKIALAHDPQTAGIVRAAMASEQALSSESAMEAVQIRHAHLRKEQEEVRKNFPYGLPVSKDHNSLEDMGAMAQIRLSHLRRNQELLKKQRSRLEGEHGEKGLLAQEREATLEAAKSLAKMLIDVGVKPDTDIYKKTLYTEKRWGTFASQDKLRGTVEKFASEKIDEGWVLPVTGQIEDYATVILCKDGRILSGYGNLTEGKTNKFEVRENIIAKRNEEGQPTAPDHIYSSYLTEDFRSDVAASNLPTGNNILGRAHSIIEREHALQLALGTLYGQRIETADNSSA